MKNIYDSGAQCAGSREQGQLDLADVRTILAREELKVFSNKQLHLLISEGFLWKEDLLPCQKLTSL